MARYLTWRVEKLKLELAGRGARVSGRKRDLIERLVAYDRNQNFVQDPIILPAPLDVGWPVSGFQQLNNQHKLLLPKITKEQIDTYFLYRLAGDKQCTGDIKALEKGREMLAGQRILACSIQVVDQIYLSGIVAASMKNQVTYNYKIKIEKSTGDPLNSHCECPSGKGPHGTCKHVAAVLLMLKDFIHTGAIDIEKSCTENLQTFHKPRSLYSGEAVDSENLPSKRDITEDFLKDPRPEKYRNNPGYNDYVRNCVTNYCAHTSADIGYRYLYKKADIQAASQDHDYCEIPLTENFVENALVVTDIDVINIELNTKKQSNSKTWHHQRMWRLTASNFGNICKMTSRRNKKKLCECLLKPKNLNHVKAIIHGKKYEGKARREFEKVYKVKVKPAGFFVSQSMPYLGASPDGIIDDISIIEIKCPYNGRHDKIAPGKNLQFLMYNSQGHVELNPTSNYCYQVQGQLLLSKREICYFIVYTFCDIFVQKIYINHSYCNYSLVPKLDLFFRTHFRPYIASTL